MGWPYIHWLARIQGGLVAAMSSLVYMIFQLVPSETELAPYLVGGAAPTGASLR
jgi:hypothetical protein